MLDIAELIGDLIQAPCAPTLARRLRIFEQRVTALNDPVRNDPMKRRTVEGTRAGEPDELLHVLESFVGEELEADYTEISGDHRFQLRRFFCGSFRLVRLSISLLLLGD